MKTKKAGEKKFNKYDYDPFDQWIWRDYDGKNRVDPQEFIESNTENYIFIGTDSQCYSKKSSTIFTTVIIAYQFGRGGAVIMSKDKTSFMDSLRQRLLMEAMRSLEAAWFVDKFLLPENVITIHLDVNQNLKFKSARYKDELVGLVAGQGFKALCKPDSWCASKVADRKC